MHLVHNERTKLTATWFNGLATALVAAGGFAPLAALSYGIADLRTGVTAIGLISGVCFCGGAFLHFIGLAYLRRLRE